MRGKRSKLTSWGARDLFKATSGVHPRNYKPVPMRGGFRI